MKLGSLVSSGKDSVYAMHLMKKKGHEIACIMTMKSENKDSYMFHTPAIEMVKLQAESFNIPLIEHKTKGEKEKELEDLKEIIKKAKNKFGIEGITTGALCSQYQKERIEKICDELKLECFSPLWHMDQETELRKIIDAGFKFILTRVAADGLDESWLGREITPDDVDKLVELNKKIGMNISFEGGEAESLVIDGPIFSKKIEIIETEKIMENEHTGNLIIKKAELRNKS